jgi:hypothetical protein
VRVESKTWGVFDGGLLNLSYGRGRLELVVSDGAGDRMQAAVCALPMPDFPTGVMRGRFHPENGDLYICGLSAWASRQTQQEGGFYRLRPTGKPACLPLAWQVGRDHIDITFSDATDALTASDVKRYRVKTWTVARSASYGGPHTEERNLAVTDARLLPDARTIRLKIPGLAPTRGIEIAFRWRSVDGSEVERVLTGTINQLAGTPRNSATPP